MENVNEKLKKVCFLANVSDEEIINFLKECGYSLDTQIYYKSDGARKAIERTYDPKTHKIILEVCCKKDEDVLIHNILMNKLGPVLKEFVYDYNSRLIFIKDYDIIEMHPHGSNGILQNAYAQFMYKKFGERYRKNYNRDINKQNKKQDTERE
ncbi:MAG: hypothetical protein E7376_00920 [Clostridiales bacterium]|nr:hypothetical protein [Clostridiales bacterium]